MFFRVEEFMALFPAKRNAERMPIQEIRKLLDLGGRESWRLG